MVDNHLDPSKSTKPATELQLAELLPTPSVIKRLKSRWAILSSRVLVKYIEKLRNMKSHVIKHITHPYSEQMKEKSELVSINIIEYYIFYVY